MRRLATFIVLLCVLASPASAWRQGKFLVGQTNLDGFDNLTDLPFANFMLGFGSVQASGGTYGFPAILNANQLPVSSPAATVFGTTRIPISYNGNWRFSWAGGPHSIQFARPTSVTSDPTSCIQGSTASNTTISGTSCVIDFSFTTSSGTVTIDFLSGSSQSSDANTPVLCRTSAPYTGDCAAVTANPIAFNADFLTPLRLLNPYVIRALGWTDPNDQNDIANAALISPVTSIVFGPRWDPSIWAGTASGTDTYAATLAGFALIDGATIQVQFTNANTVTAPTLNVNSLGAVTIVDTSAAALSVGTIAASSLRTLIYDATLNKFLEKSGGVTGNTPLAVSVALSNALNINLWYNIPPHATDAYITQIATYIKSNLSASLTAHIEYANEIWNFGGGFQATSWAVQRGLALGFPNANNEPYHGFYGLRFRQIAGLFKSVYGAQTNYKMVLAFQAFGNTAQTNKYRMQGFDLCGMSCGNATYQSLIGVDYNTAPNRPVDFDDIQSYAGYYQGAIINDGNSYSGTYAVGDLADCSVAGTNSGGLLCAANNYTLGTTSAIAAAFAWIDNDVRAGTKNSTLGSQTLSALNSNIYPGWNTIAASYSLPVYEYEGGYQGLAPTVAQCTAISYPGTAATDCGTSGTIATMLAAYKNGALFKQLVIDQNTQFTAASPVGSRSSWFAFQGNCQWCMYPVNIYSTPFKSFDAVQALNGHGFLLKRDLSPANDNSITPMFLNEVG